MLGKSITLQVWKSGDKDIWRVFREHHYLTKDFNKGAFVYLITLDNTIVGFNSILNQPSGTSKFSFRTHRLVILPDYQGLGIGTKFEEFIGEYLLKQGRKLYLRTTHLRLGRHCLESNKWVAASQNLIVRKKNDNSTKYKTVDCSRKAYSFEYVGEDFNKKEHQYIICLGNTTKKVATEMLSKVIDTSKFPIILTGNPAQSNNIFEQLALKQGIRTQILSMNVKGEEVFVKSAFINKYSLICPDEMYLELVKPYLSNCIEGYVYDSKKGIKKVI